MKKTNLEFKNKLENLKLETKTSRGAIVRIVRNNDRYNLEIVSNDEVMFSGEYTRVLYAREKKEENQYLTVTFRKEDIKYYGIKTSEKIKKDNGNFNISIEIEVINKLKDLIKKGNELAEEYFENIIDNVELERLSNYSYVISNEDEIELYKEVKEVATDFNNYKMQFQESKLVRNSESKVTTVFDEDYETYSTEETLYFKREKAQEKQEIENKAIEEYKQTDEYKERVINESKLYELASQTSFEDFEDLTGLSRETYEYYKQ